VIRHYCHYVGDGYGDVAIAGLGLPPSALLDGASPSAETPFFDVVYMK
jgi:hypothetical protein